MANHKASLNEFVFDTTIPPDAKKRLVEMVALNRRGREDVCIFAEELLGMPLNDFQRGFLRQTTSSRESLMDKAWALAHNLIPYLGDVMGMLYGKNIAFPSNQVGKGLDENEVVLSNNGWVKMKNLKVGDKIFTQDGTETKIKGIFPQGKRNLFRFTFDDGSEVVADSEHRWSVMTPVNRFSKSFNDTKRYGKIYPNKTYGTYHTMTTLELIERFGSHPNQSQRCAIPVVKPIQFSARKTIIDPYLLGLILGDASITRNNIQFCGIDPELHQAFGKLARARTGKSKVPVSKINLNKECVELGLMGHRAWEKFIPKDYLWNSVENRIAILQGLMDTDGTIGEMCRMEYCTTSPQLAEDVKFIVQSLGGKCEIKERFTQYTHKGEKKRGRKSYRVIPKIQDINIFRLKRKAEKFYNVRYAKERLIYSIEQIEDGKSICLSVDHPSELFVVKDFIVTHNTVMIAIKHLWFNYYKIGMDLSADIFDKTYYATLNISPHSRQVKACSRYMMEILNGEFIINQNGKTSINKLSPLLNGFFISYNSTLGEIRFSNGAVFYSVPIGQDQASSLAGGQFAYISYDECAQSNHLENELGAKIMSRLIKYGVCLDLISTAEVDSNSHQQYARLVKLGQAHQDGWWAIGGTLDQNIFIPAAQREKIKADLKATDPKKYRQVAFGEFVTGGKRFFDQPEIDQLWKLRSPKRLEPGHKYLLISDWGMSDTGDPSEFAVIDYTNFAHDGYLEIVAWEQAQGGSPFMQFALLRSIYDAYTDYEDDGMTVRSYPTFLMDAAALGGVTIKKMLVQLRPIGFNIEKDEALFILKTEMSRGRKFEVNDLGDAIEHNLEFGSIRSFFIQGLADQLGMYHLEDKKLTQDKVMTLMMGVSYIVKKNPRGKPLSSANISGMRSWQRSHRPITRTRIKH